MPSQGLSIRILKDEISPVAAKLLTGLQNPKPILEAIGLEIVSITQRAFRDASLRVTAWAPKRDGTPATLIQSGALRQSIRITDIGATTVTVGSDRIYAAMQQLGGTIVAKKRALVFNAGGVKVFAKKVTIPPRPFFPIDEAGNLALFAVEKIERVLTDALRVYLQP